MASLLRIANLRKSYQVTKNQTQEVLKGIDVEFKGGDLVALLGESGCGKSTLINILGGLDMNYTGSIVLKDDFIRDFTEAQMDDYRKKRVGLIFQNYNLIPHMNIQENVEIAMSMSDIDHKTRTERAMDLLRMVGLQDFAKKRPNQLSGGQRQRVAIARALANNPTILLADEPTGALDPEAAEVVMQILRKIAENGKLVIIVTHSEKVAANCNRVVKMEDGKIVHDQVMHKANYERDKDFEIQPRSIQTREVVKIAKQNLWRNRNRSILIAVGLAVGMAAVLLILCLGAGLSGYVNHVYKSNLQSNYMIVTSNLTISSSDISKIENNFADSINSITKTYSTSKATYGCNEKTGNIDNLGVFYSGKFQPEILYGELSGKDDDTNYMIVNTELAKTLGDGKYLAAVGQTVTITLNSRTQTFYIAGIYEDTFNDDSKSRAYVSESGMLDLLSKASLDSVVNTLYVAAADIGEVNALASDLKSLGYSVQKSSNTADSVLNYIDMGTTILTAVSTISMVVSALMIFIVLYISVTERMKEIGIMRAIGARKSDIKKLFLFEAAMMGLIAGVLAVASCAVITLIVDLVCLSTLHYFAFISFHFGYYALGLLSSILIATLAGVAPAYRAAELDPVESLRAE